MSRLSLLSLMEDRPVLYDGAVGTEIMHQAQGVNPQALSFLNYTSDLPKEVHQSYIDAGADVITSNTFLLPLLALQGLNTLEACAEAMRHDVWEARVLARNAGRAVYVAASLGPVHDPMTSSFSHDLARQVYAVLAQAAIAADADVILFDTMRSMDEITAAMEAMNFLARNDATCPPVHLSIGPTGLASSLDLIFLEENFSPDILGINCVEWASCDYPAAYLPRKLGTPFVVLPSGTTQLNDDMHACHSHTLLQWGAKGIGGCCGTTPEYIRRLHVLMTDAPVIPYSHAQPE